VAIQSQVKFEKLYTASLEGIYKTQGNSSDGKTDRRAFHNIRRTFTDLACNSGTEAYLVLSDLTGNSRICEGQVVWYGNGFSQLQKQAVLEGLTIPVDLSGHTHADFECVSDIS